MDDLMIMAKVLKQQQLILRLVMELTATGLPSSPGLRMAIDCTLDKADELLKRIDTERG